MKLRQKTPTEKPVPLAQVVHSPGVSAKRAWIDKRGRVYFWTLTGQLRRVPDDELAKFMGDKR